MLRNSSDQDPFDVSVFCDSHRSGVRLLHYLREKCDKCNIPIAQLNKECLVTTTRKSVGVYPCNISKYFTTRGVSGDILIVISECNFLTTGACKVLMDDTITPILQLTSAKLLVYVVETERVFKKPEVWLNFPEIRAMQTTEACIDYYRNNRPMDEVE
jgi:hypothetical protein